jgi:hypothetical protein
LINDPHWRFAWISYCGLEWTSYYFYLQYFMDKQWLEFSLRKFKNPLIINRTLCGSNQKKFSSLQWNYYTQINLKLLRIKRCGAFEFKRKDASFRLQKCILQCLCQRCNVLIIFLVVWILQRKMSGTKGIAGFLEAIKVTFGQRLLRDQTWEKKNTYQYMPYLLHYIFLHRIITIGLKFVFL